MLRQIMEIAQQAGELIRTAADITPEEKTGFRDLVTQYDRQVQALLQNSLRAVLPQAAFLGEEGTRTAMETGIGYLRFMSVFFCLIGFKTSTDGLLRGAGDMTMFTIANLVNLGIRVAVAMIFAPKYGISVVWTAVPIGWFANWAISYLEYRTGKWKQKLPAMTAA